MNDRLKVARLITMVLTKQIVVRQALSAFPENSDDKSIITAYHALIHYESDEELRMRDPMYKEEQDDYLALLAETLSMNRTIPQNIVNSYKDYNSDVALPKDRGVRLFLKKLCELLNIK